MSQQPIGIGMIGCGTVGQAVAKLLSDHAAQYESRLGRRLELRRVLVRDASKAREGLGAGVLTSDADAFFATPGLDIVIEVAGGLDPAGAYVRRALETGRDVVTANKALLAEHGPELFALARKLGRCIAFEATCAGGIPLLNAIKFGLAANRITAVYGILNGTCNYILTQMTTGGKTYKAALAEAQAKGYAEADPTLDINGSDAAQKLTIVASLAFGVRAKQSDVRCEGIKAVDRLDIRFAKELEYEIKLLAIGELIDGRLLLRVHPCFIDADEPLAKVHGGFNAMSVYGDAVGHTLYYGRGAGGRPTASAVMGDVLNVASGWYRQAFASLRIWPDQQPPAVIADADLLQARYYLRVNAMDKPGVMGRLMAVLGEHQIGISSVLQHEPDDEPDQFPSAPAAGNVPGSRFVPVVITTHEASHGSMRSAADRIKALDVIRGTPVCIRIVDLPDG